MAEIQNLDAAREILKSSIEKSRNIAIAIDETGSRMKETSHNLALLQANVQEMAHNCAFYEIRSHVDRAIGPSTTVLKVLDVVYELQESLEVGPGTDIYTYVTTIKRLQDALKLLANNCSLVILWLQDVVQFLEKNKDDLYLYKVTKVLKILTELKAKRESFQQKGGVLSSAFDKVESEYKHLLTKYSSSFPEHIVRELQAIIELLAANNRIQDCVSIYTEVRIANARATLKGLDLHYLDIQLSESNSVETVERYIDPWDNHMEFIVRHLLQTEYKLCHEVFHKKIGSDVSMNCFAKIATQCGFHEILNFGCRVTNCKKEAIKLLKLLKIFATLDKLRLDFNELFTGKFCVKIQNQTRELVEKVVNRACEIFFELLVQVELQRESSPPLDGSVPRLVLFVSEYCNQLLEEENTSFLVRVLEIYQLWNKVKFEQGVMHNEILKIMRALEVNLETWAKSYNDKALSCLFTMNNHWYLCNNIKGTKLGDLMGESWLRACEEYIEYYATLYVHESWEKLLVLLSEEGLILFPGGRAVDQSLVKKRLTVFCEAFDDVYKKQCKWILHDKALRWKIFQLVVESIVVPYKRYLERFMPGFEDEVDIGNNVKYSAVKLENLVGLLFQPKVGKFGSRKCTGLIGMENNNTVINHFSSTPAAA
ncbi:hypothetical protein ACJIZ3_021055 [Penstemon smallii]|uniref:Exocyst subunit Exo70 family protein n=1 Tax=Penstemon smallii TaxID=265156 RepID=A0ABD3SKV3_9LAMI